MLKDRFDIKKIVNLDYLKPFDEWRLARLCASKIKRVDCINNNILIISTCLIWDFAASIPAICDYIQRNKNKKIDIIVTSALKPLAEKINWINNVFIAKSVAKRNIEIWAKKSEIKWSYEEVIILRTSADVLRNIIPNIKASKIKLVVKEVAKYSVFELLKWNLLKKRPKQWRDFNFELLWWTPKDFSFNEMIEVGENDISLVSKHLDQLNENRKKIIIHTWASWYMMRWDNEKWIDSIRKINTLWDFDFIFIWNSTKDIEDFNYISSKLDFTVHSLISKISILDLILVMRQSDFFIWIDSWPWNLAHLSELRSLIIYWPWPHTFMSNDKDDVILDKSGWRWLYQRYFVKKNWYIDKITSDEVYEGFKMMFNK